jgi:hypothetical protein
VFELGLAKTLFYYPVIMEPGSREAYEKKGFGGILEEKGIRRSAWWDPQPV